MKLARSLIAVFAALTLLGAQQAAFAHWAAHLGAPAEIALESPDPAHAGAATLAQFCAGCAAFAGLDATLPAAGAKHEPAAAIHVSSLVSSQAVPAATPRHFDSRAPPVSL
jgi:hypothetical protein